MLLGMTAINWVIAVAMLGAWPLTGVLVYFVVKSWRKHDAMERAEGRTPSGH